METQQTNARPKNTVVHMQHIDDATRTFCGRRIEQQRHVTTRFKECTCRACWAVIVANYPGVTPGRDFVIVRLR